MAAADAGTRDREEQERHPLLPGAPLQLAGTLLTQATYQSDSDNLRYRVRRSIPKICAARVMLFPL
jgi:hypothetical protein